jgi:hypothetical protein
MRPLPAILLCLLILQGCARQPARPRVADADADPLARARPAAAALVFEPGMAAALPQGALAREGRDPEAFVGYAEGVTEYFYVRWDDRQGNWGSGRHGGGGAYDRFERRAVSEKVGALYR